jgi:hypothetical protein
MVVARFAGSGGRVAVRPRAGAKGRHDPSGHRPIRPAELERCAAASDPGRNHATTANRINDLTQRPDSVSDHTCNASRKSVT